MIRSVSQNIESGFERGEVFGDIDNLAKYIAAVSPHGVCRRWIIAVVPTLTRNVSVYGDIQAMALAGGVEYGVDKVRHELQGNFVRGSYGE